MLSCSAAFFTLAAVSFIAAGRGWPLRAFGALALVSSLTTCVLAWGGALGPLVQLVLAMTAASLLVLVLPVRVQLARPVALVSAGLGLLLLVSERLTS